MRIFATMVAVLVAMTAGSSTGQARENSTIYLEAERVLDVESGQILANQTIVIEGDRIKQIGDSDAVPVPDGARVIDLTGQTVLPGLMDAHTHLLGDADIQGYRRLTVSLPRATIKGVKNARKTLLAGFTTARLVGAPGYGDVALRDAIAAGEVAGPRLFVAGPPVGITGGHCSDSDLLPSEMNHTGEGVADGPWALRAKVRQNIKYGVDLIKTCSTGGVLSKGTDVGAPQTTPEELAAIVDEAHMHGRKVASHAHGAEGIRNAILAGVDSIEHASFIDDEGIALARANSTALVMDIYLTEYLLATGEAAGFLPESIAKERRTGRVQRENFRKAHAAGANIVFGTDAAVYPHGHNARQFSRMVQFGMSPLQAIQAATIRAAELIGIEDAGTLTPGNYADIIAVPGHPLENISVMEAVQFVMKGGVVYKQDGAAAVVEISGAAR